MEEDFVIETTPQKKPVRVSGHLEDKRGIYQIILSWYDTDGKRSRKSISTGLIIKGNKKRAEDMMREKIQEKEISLASLIEGGDMLFADFMEVWLDVIKPKIKLTTYGGYQMNVQRVIVPYFRERRIALNKLTADDINDFYEEKLTTLKATSVHKFHANISKALKYAVIKNYIPYSIMNRVNRPKAERYVGRFLKQSEAVALFEAVRGHKLELGVIFGAFYGLRRGEIVGLKWTAIDFEANTITIEYTVTVAHIDGKSVVVEGDTTKTKSSFRTLPLVPGFSDLLLSLKAQQEEYKRLCGNMYNKADKDYIYVDAMGYRIKPDYLSREFPTFLEQHGFRRMRFHDLRHSSASLLLANGVSLKEIQEWLGHSDFAITANLYAHLEFDSKRNAAKAMSWLDKTSIGSCASNDNNEEKDKPN